MSYHSMQKIEIQYAPGLACGNIHTHLSHNDPSSSHAHQSWFSYIKNKDLRKTATCRGYTPAMLAPVNNVIPGASPPIRTLFGIKSFFKHNAGCRNSSKSMKASGDSTSSGRHEGVPIAREALAKLNKQSIYEKQRIRYRYRRDERTRSPQPWLWQLEATHLSLHRIPYTDAAWSREWQRSLFLGLLWIFGSYQTAQEHPIGIQPIITQRKIREWWDV